MVKRGDFVEFTDRDYFDYTGGQAGARYGICIEDTPDNAPTIRVRTVKGIETARYIHAVSWLGWMPEELEDIWEREFSTSDWEDY